MRAIILADFLLVTFGLAFGCSRPPTRAPHANPSSEGSVANSASTNVVPSATASAVGAPSIALEGPNFGGWHKIGDKGAHFVRFDHDSSHVYFTLAKDGAHEVMIAPVAGDAAATVYAPYPYEWDVDKMLCPPSEDPCILLPLILSRSVEVTVVNRSKHFQREYVGDLDSGVPDNGLSPDGAYFVTSSLSGDVRFIRTDRANDVGTVFRRPSTWNVLRSWSGQGTDLRAIIEVRDRRKPRILERLSIDPRTGASTKVPSDGDDQESPLDDYDTHQSADRTRTFTCSRDGRQVAVTTLADKSSRTFIIDDTVRSSAGRWCPVRWASNEYIEFAGKPLRFIDVKTLKLLRHADDGTPFTRIEYNSTFTWAARETAEGLEVSRIVTH